MINLVDAMASKDTRKSKYRKANSISWNVLKYALLRSENQKMQPRPLNMTASIVMLSTHDIGLSRSTKRSIIQRK